MGRVKVRTKRVWPFNRVLTIGSRVLSHLEWRRLFQEISRRTFWKRSCLGLGGVKTDVQLKIVSKMILEISDSIACGKEMFRRGKGVKFKIYLQIFPSL